MLPSLGLFKSIRCPHYPKCQRDPCFYSHNLPARSTNPESKKAKSSIHQEGVDLNQNAKRRKMTHRLEQTNTISKPKQIIPSLISTTTPSVTRPSNSSIHQTSNPSAHRTSNPTANRSNPTPLQQTNRMPSEPTKTRPLSALEAARKRAPHPQSTPKSIGPPTILPNLKSVVPLKVRQLIATKLYEAFQRIYEPILKKKPTLATEHAKAQEEKILSSTTNVAGYKQMATTTLMHLKKRPLATDESDVGLDGDWVDPQEQSKAAQAIWDKAQACILSETQQRELEYPMPDLLTTSASSPVKIATVGEVHVCDRCSHEYLIKAILSKEDMDACAYHPARIRMVIRDGQKQKAYGCCEDPLGSPGCARGPHVYKDTDAQVLHQKIPFVKPPVSAVHHRKLIALDCEMGYTTAGMELIRLTAVDEKMQVLLDELVLPSSMVVDLNTHYSGVKTLEGVRHDLMSLRQALFQYLSQDTILIGHGLENDLNALRIIHSKVIDTVALYPHKNGLPYRNKLSYLTSTYLKKFIQIGSEGHDSLEDATVCIELLKHYIEHIFRK